MLHWVHCKNQLIKNTYINYWSGKKNKKYEQCKKKRKNNNQVNEYHDTEKNRE